jgi:hypothetical protein
MLILCISLLNSIAMASSTSSTTTAYYTCNACARIIPGYSCPQSCPYLAKCSAPQDASCSATSTTTTSTTTTILPCTVDTASVGQCDFSNTLTATTPSSYYSSAGNGQLTPQQFGGVQTTPVTMNVIAYDSGNPQWLITCPNTPNPANTWEYVVSSQSSPVIGGDECLASSAPISTSDTGNLYISWGPTTPATANVQANQQGGQLSITNLAYAGEAYNSVSGLSSANTSNGYDTFTNVFSPIPSDQQSGIWTWTAKLGNPSALSYDWQNSQAFNSLLVTQDFNNQACQYSYDYSAISDINSIKSYNQVPVPVTQTPKQNYISFNNQTYSNFQLGSQHGANAIEMSQCYIPSILSAWHLAGYNGVLNYQGNTQNPVCVYQYSDTPEYWTAYNTPNGETAGFAPSNSLTFENFPYMPYFLYNFSIPISSGSIFNNGMSYLNESYYVYSPHNIQSPGNFIDPLMIGGGNMSGSTSGIFMSTNSVLTQLSYSAFFGSSTTPVVPGTDAYNGLEVQSKNFIIAANYITASNEFGLTNAKPIGTSYSISNITNTSYLAPSASNYMFAVSSTPSCPSTEQCTNKMYYLYGITLAPRGYFNPVLYSPSNAIAESESGSSAPNFQKAISAYWYNVSAIQSSTGYVTKMYNLTNLTSGFYPWLNYCNPSSECSQSICRYDGEECFTPPPEYTMPIAIASDSEGDTFIMTANVTPPQAFAQTSPGKGFDLLVISNNGIVAAANVVGGPYASQFGQDVAPASSLGNGYPASMAVSPDGKYLYVSERGMPRVLIYHLVYYGNTLNPSYSGAINLAYNNVSSGYNLSISDYLQGGGPFNSSLLKMVYSNPTSQIGDAGYNGNAQIVHVPLGVADSGGILYVLDEWLFNANSCTFCSGHTASDVILMLRAFTYNGTEIPIHPTTYQDMFNPNGASLSTGYTGAYSNPPYGWPLSANFSIWYQSGQGSAKYLSYCSFGCTYSAANAPQESQNFGGFPPDGPFIGAEWATPLEDGSTPNPDILPPNFSISSDFNNTIYLDEGAYSSPIPYTNNLCYTYSNYFGGTYSPPNCVGLFYNEIAALHFDPYNYTRIASTPIASGNCYIGIDKTWEAAVSSMQSWASTLSNTPCQIIDELSTSTVPFSGMPDAFTYAEGLGNPSIYTAAPIPIPSTLSYSKSSQSSESHAGMASYSFSSSGSSSQQQPLPTLQLSPSAVIIGQNVIAQCTVSTGTCDIEEPLNQPIPTSILPASCISSSSSGSYTDTCTFNSIDLGAGTFTFYSRSPGSLSYASANLIVASSFSPIISINPSVATLGQSVNVIASCIVSTDTCDIEMPLGTQIQNSAAQAVCSPSQAVNGNTETCTINSNSLGTGSYTIYAKDISGQYAGNFVSATLLIIPPVTTVSSFPSEPGISFLKSSISGSLLVPYSYSYALTQAWLPQVDNSLTNNAICIANPLDFGPAQASSGTAYGLSSAVSANSVLNETIQSGLLLAQFENTKQYFTANLSDAGLIFPPQLYVNIFDNRIFGEAYINQSVSPKGLTYPPYASTPSTSTNPGGTLVVNIANTPQAFGIEDLITVHDYTFPPGSSKISATLPPGVEYYIPITLGTPGSPSPWTTVNSPTVQQEIKIDLADYPQYVNATPFNVEWFYPNNGQIIPSWLESGASNTMTATYWLKISNTVNTIAIGFGPMNVNFFNTQDTGEAPRLYSTYSGAYQPSTYGEFDDGASVFTNYWNFAGTSMPSGWNSINDKYANPPLINNGIKFTYPSGYVYPNYGYSLLYTTSTYAYPNIFEINATSHNAVRSVVGLGASNTFNTGYTSTSQIQPTGFENSYLSLFGRYGSFHLLFQPIEADGSMGTGVTNSINNGANPYVQGIGWYSTGSEAVSAYAYDGSYNTYTSFADSTITIGPQYLMFGIDAAGNTNDGCSSCSLTVNWARTRVPPPNGQMPTYTLGIVQPQYSTSLTIQDAATGQVLSQASTPGPELQYTLCTGGNACPYPGNYLLTGCGITNTQNGGQTPVCINNIPLRVIPSKPISLVINASHSYNYSQENFIQTSSYGSFPGFSAENAIEQQPVAFNALCKFCSAAGYYYNPSNLFSGNNILTYSSANVLNFAQLFNQLKAQSYLYTIGLDLIYNPSVLGYNRFNYTYIDEFNNTINMPLDVDLANITSINLNTVSSLSPTNTNETTITVNGIAGYYPSAFSTQLSPLPANSPIYLYYDTNINFYTDGLSPSTNPAAYYAYAEQCAFGTGSDCTLANPVFSSNVPPLGQGAIGSQLANVVTFNTQYNSLGQCPPQPTSLLTPANTWECNIYGDFGLPQTGTSANGNIEYCVPDYVNGTGVLTSQLGLLGVATTNSAGDFGYTFTACGTGTARIQANYYGSPSPQPQVFYQPPLQQPQSSNTAEQLRPLLIPSIEFNYSVAPNSTYTSLNIGTYYLSFGDITSVAVMALAGAIAIYLIIRLKPNTKA